MPVQAFTFPVPEIRFFQAGRHVFKFKITCGGNYSGEDMPYDDFANEELEDSIRIVLASLDTLQPFATNHFNIFPYKCRWERVSKLHFELNGVRLSPYPYLITLYVEPRLHSQGHTDKQTEDWNVTSGTQQETKQDGYSCPSSPCRPRKRSKLEQPPESALLQPSMNTTSLKHSHRDSPELADEAEVIVNDSQANAALEGSLISTQDDSLAEVIPELHSDRAEQTAPDEPEHTSPEEDKTSFLTRLARAAFPLSHFFKK